jgi:hypothetical protein
MTPEMVRRGKDKTMDYYIGLEGAIGVNEELKVLKETDKSYYLQNEFGIEFWLPKSCFESDGVLSESGMRLYREKVKE